tara:strand:- start:57 stop:746 length:690 start_codon:yes stop_codon:yes gene_type:complete
MAYTQKWGLSRESSNDSISAGKAWQKMKAGYLKKPGGKDEWNREKNEFYYDTDKKKLRLIPTDDGEIQDQGFVSKLKSWQKAPERHTSKDTKTDEDELVFNMTPDVSEEEAAEVRKKFDETYMKGRGKVEMDSTKVGTSTAPTKVHNPFHEEPRQEEYLRQQVQKNYPRPMPINAPEEFLQTAPKRLFQSYEEEGNKGWPTKEYLQGKYEDYMGYRSENPNAPGFRNKN